MLTRSENTDKPVKYHKVVHGRMKEFHIHVSDNPEYYSGSSSGRFSYIRSSKVFAVHHRALADGSYYLFSDHCNL